MRAADLDTAIFNVDLQITKTDGVPTYIPGNSVTYTIVVSNPTGPANATGGTVTDVFPQAASISWTCAGTGGASCTANGNGNINDTVNVPIGGTLTYTATVNILASATGNLTNTATIIPPGGYTDTVPANNSASDTDTPNPLIDLAITKTDGSANYTAGAPISYTIVVTNAGPSNAVGASMADAVPAAITGITVNCVANGSASCGINASAGNNVSYTGTNIPVGAGNFLTITVNGTVSVGTKGNLTNTSTVSAGATQTDPIPGNNTATDTDTPPVVDLQITLTDNATDYAANLTKIYTIVVSKPVHPTRLVLP